MDEPQEPQAENQVAEDSNQPAPPADEPTTSEEPKAVETEESPSSAEETTEETPAEEAKSERKPTRAERKIREQHRTIKDLQAELDTKQPSQLPGVPTPTGNFDIQEYADPVTGNLDIAAVNEAINKQSVQSANAIAQLQVRNELSQFQAKANLDSDVKSVPQEFPEFDDKSDQFNPDLLAEVEQAYKDRAFRQVGVDAVGNPIRVLDPDVRLANIAASYAKAARSAATRQAADVKASVAKAADETAPRPGPQPPREERKFEDLSLEEMKAQLGVHKS